jgi:hypothetical protein
MAWKREGKLFVPSDNQEEQPSTKSETLTPGGIIVEGQAAPPHIPRQVRRFITKSEYRQKKKEAKRATREMLRNRWLPLLKPKEDTLRDNKGEQ